MHRGKWNYFICLIQQQSIRGDGEMSREGGCVRAKFKFFYFFYIFANTVYIKNVDHIMDNSVKRSEEVIIIGNINYKMVSGVAQW